MDRNYFVFFCGCIWALKIAIARNVLLSVFSREHIFAFKIFSNGRMDTIPVNAKNSNNNSSDTNTQKKTLVVIVQRPLNN